jgi:hypothetical protein
MDVTFHAGLNDFSLTIISGYDSIMNGINNNPDLIGKIVPRSGLAQSPSKAPRMKKKSKTNEKF